MKMLADMIHGLFFIGENFLWCSHMTEGRRAKDTRAFQSLSKNTNSLMRAETSILNCFLKSPIF